MNVLVRLAHTYIGWTICSRNNTLVQGLQI